MVDIYNLSNSVTGRKWKVLYSLVKTALSLIYDGYAYIDLATGNRKEGKYVRISQLFVRV